MQMLGTQVAFGFQFQSLFQDRLDLGQRAIQLAAFVGLAFIVLTLGLLIAAPAIHRIAEGGAATERMRRLTARAARAALLTLSISIAAALFVGVRTELGLRAAWIAAVVAALVTVAAWEVWGMLLRQRTPRRTGASDVNGTLHDRIDSTLTESRVILPGAQALFGFQLIVMLTKPFTELPAEAKLVHVGALLCVALTIILLMAPAAIHRLSFAGEDTPQMLRFGSGLVTAALLPLGLGIAGDVYVAVGHSLDNEALGIVAALGILALLLSIWYAWPLLVRARNARHFGTRAEGHR